ncbi:MAG: MFS transporter [Lutimonas sp.]
MLDRLLKPYKGFSQEVWLLALITFVNRAGAMVIPFLSLYLTKDIGFSLSQVGWIMSCFGFGSLLGVFLGGKLTDQIGYYKVMYSSLLLGGLVFIILQFFQSLIAVCIGFFILSLVADAFRPAIWVALSANSREENRTRSVTLIRLAINLGFSIGPALGGLIIAGIGYRGLFWADGLTCMIAGLLLLKLLVPKKAHQLEEFPDQINQSPYRDKPYILFWIAMFLIGFCFMQYFATVPLFFHEVYDLSEKQIGYILALNGFLIFLVEMPIIHHLVVKKTNMMNMTIVGAFLLLLSFLAMNIPFWIGIPILVIVLMTFGEILNFPFSNTYALQRAQRGNKGAYMALYSMSFSVAHILGPNIGMQLTEKFEFRTTWIVMATLLFIAMILFLVVKRLDNLALKN